MILFKRHNAAGGSFEEQRRDMVERQLRRNGIRDERVLDAMGTVPREAFVPPNQQAYAYVDGALPIEHGQSNRQQANEQAIGTAPAHKHLAAGLFRMTAIPQRSPRRNHHL